MMKLFKILFVLPFLFFFLPMQAQVISEKIEIGDTTQVHVLNTLRGDRFVGRVIKIENTKVFFLFKEKNELEFDLAEIKSLRVEGESGKRQGDDSDEPKSDYERKFEERQAKYAYEASLPVLPAGAEANFFGTTGFTYGKGNGEYRNTMIFINRVDMGLGENIDIGLDLIPLIGVNMLGARIKAGFSLSENAHLGVGASTYAFFSTFDDTFGGSHTYAVATIGSRERYLNFGYGYLFPYEQDFFTDPDTPVVNIGGSFRFAERWRVSGDIVLLTDDFYEPDFYNFGVAWFNRNNRFDFGITVVPLNNNNDFGPDFVPVPFATYAFMFGKNR